LLYPPPRRFCNVLANTPVGIRIFTRVYSEHHWHVVRACTGMLYGLAHGGTCFLRGATTKQMLFDIRTTLEATCM
jgi:hypothetical protein